MHTFVQKQSSNALTLIHSSERPFCCIVCNKLFTKSSHLKSHMLVHTGERPFLCEVCNKQVSESSNLKKHLLAHTGERAYSCNDCGKKFVQLCSLKLYILRTRGYRGGSPTAVRPSDPALCGSCPLVTPYYCRLGDLLCYFVYIVLCVHYCLCIHVSIIPSIICI